MKLMTPILSLAFAASCGADEALTPASPRDVTVPEVSIERFDEQAGGFVRLALADVQEGDELLVGPIVARVRGEALEVVLGLDAKEIRASHIASVGPRVPRPDDVVWVLRDRSHRRLRQVEAGHVLFQGRRFDVVHRDRRMVVRLDVCT